MSSSSKLYKSLAPRPRNDCGDGGGGNRKTTGEGASSSDDKMCSAVSPASFSAVQPPILTAEQREELRGCDFPFDSFVLEGGGNKGLSTTGSMRVLEELGYMGNIKRFAGASAGAMVASLVAVGYNSHDIEAFLCGDIQKVFLDARFGLLSLFPNMVSNYGWHPGKRIYRWFGEKVKEKMGNADLTFEELYKKTGRELCITVTNMNSMDCTYCHVKTKPDMPIRQAVRMSACIPGVFCPVIVESGKQKDYYVDGGLLCNYPIHCYDGWFLSMAHEDSFLKRLQPIEELPKLWDPKERFGTKNEKTFGMLLYAGGEREIMKEDLIYRFNRQIKPAEIQNYPDTKLANKRAEVMKEQKEKAKEHRTLLMAFSRFIELLEKNDIDQSGTISREEFDKAMNQTNSEFTDEDKKRLFGDNFRDTKALFDRLDTTADQEISFRELMSFAERQGLQIMEYFRGYSRQEITDIRSYFGSIMDSLLLNMKRIFVKSADVDRTIGIDTGYLDTLDFKMEKPDQNYLVQQGKLGCMAFLRELIAEGKMVRKT